MILLATIDWSLCLFAAVVMPMRQAVKKFSQSRLLYVLGLCLVCLGIMIAIPALLWNIHSWKKSTKELNKWGACWTATIKAHWSEWSLCSTSCGWGTMSRRRELDDEECSVRVVDDTSKCYVGACPEEPEKYVWGTWTICESESVKQYRSRNASSKGKVLVKDFEKMLETKECPYHRQKTTSATWMLTSTSTSDVTNGTNSSSTSTEMDISSR